MYIIAGLGNPTLKYHNTRHNVGFDAIDVIAKKNKIKVDMAKHKALCGSGIIGGEKVLLLKPQTFMNLSGESIAEAVNYYKISPEDELIIIYDDISLEPGNMRLRRKGSAGGHNGMKSIIGMLGTDVFKRIKIGVGSKPEGWDLADYVLGRFNKEERKMVEDVFEKTEEAIGMTIEGNFDKAMNKFN